ncbi:MAG: twin-arginine translocation signal domain-containing protein [Verrucomicrobia bacterium]|nr:twin-arginine translocation signal domain-containing protein [Verrucomicrobiota bacterium]
MSTRRQFLKQAGAASAALSTLGTPLLKSRRHLLVLKAIFA